MKKPELELLCSSVKFELSFQQEELVSSRLQFLRELNRFPEQQMSFKENKVISKNVNLSFKSTEASNIVENHPIQL